MIQVFPIALSNLKLCSKTLGEHVGSDRIVFVLDPEYGRQHVKTVDGHIVGKPIANNRSDRGKDVGRIGQSFRDLPRGNSPRPTSDEGDAMAPFPTVSFHTSQAAGCIMFVILSHPVGVYCFGSIVGIEHDQGVVVDPQFVDGIEQPTGQYIELMNKIASWTSS